MCVCVCVCVCVSRSCLCVLFLLHKGIPYDCCLSDYAVEKIVCVCVCVSKPCCPLTVGFLALVVLIACRMSVSDQRGVCVWKVQCRKGCVYDSLS